MGALRVHAALARHNIMWRWTDSYERESEFLHVNEICSVKWPANLGNMVKVKGIFVRSEAKQKLCM